MYHKNIIAVVLHPLSTFYRLHKVKQVNMLVRDFLMIGCCVCVNLCFAQTHRVDSLKNTIAILEKQQSTRARDSVITNNLVGITNNFVTLYVDSAKNWLRKLEAFNSVSKWEMTNVYYLVCRSTYYTQTGLFSVALENIEKAKAALNESTQKPYNEKTHKNLYAMIVNISGAMYQTMLLDSTTSTPILRERYFAFCQEKYNLAKANNDSIKISDAEVGFGLYYFTEKKYDSAFLHYTNSLDIINKNIDEKKLVENSFLFFQYYGGIWARGLCMLYMNKEQEGFKLINSVKAECKKQRPDFLNKYLQTVIGMFLGNYYLEKKDYPNALESGLYAKQSLTASPFRDYFTMLVEKILYRSYKGVNNTEKALAAFENVEHYYALMNRKEYNERISEIQTKYETQKNETTITEQKLSLAKRRNYIIIIASLFALALVSSLFLFNNYRRKQKIKAALLQQEEKRQAIAAVLAAEENQRKRIATDLHDNLGAYTNAVLYSAELLQLEKDDDKREAIVNNLHSNSKEVIASLRETIWALKNENYSAIDCLLRLKNFMQAMAKNYDNIHFSVKGSPPENLLLQNTRALHLIRMVQETVTNAIKHAAPAKIVIDNITQNDQWMITVTDDGKGFDVGNSINADEHNGLLNLKERADTAGFEMKVESVINEGTKVIIKILMYKDYPNGLLLPSFTSSNFTDKPIL